ncbi:MAG: PilZ domain-containing protein [Terriglobales bacterium]
MPITFVICWGGAGWPIIGRMGCRREERIELRLPTTVWGMQEDGTLFVEQVRTIDISSRGARVEGLTHVVVPGAVLGVQHGSCSGRFKVVWVGKPGSAKEGQVGLTCIEVGQTLSRPILYLEEQEFYRDRYRRALEAAGYQTVADDVANYAEVLDSRQYDAVLLGHPTAAVDADEVIQEIRRRLPRTRILVLSGRPGLLSEAALASTDALLHRGAVERDLVRKIQEFIGPGLRLKWPITRFSHRYPVATSVRVRLVRSGVAQTWEGHSIDLSEDGAGLSVPADIAPGEIVALSFVLPTAAEPLLVYGTVRYRSGQQYGVEFVEITPEQRQAIRRLCEVLPPVTTPR